MPRVDADAGRRPSPPSPAAIYAQEVVVENWLAAGFAQVARHVPAAIPTLSRIAAAGTGKSRKVDSSFKVYASERRLKFTEMEYSIPRANAREAVERVLAIAARPEFEVCFPIEVRFVAGDDAMLSPAHGRDSCLRRRSPRPPRRLAALLRRRRRRHGRVRRAPALGQTAQLGAAELAKLYPRFEDFKAVRAGSTPTPAFANPYTRAGARARWPHPKRRRKR